MTTTAHQGKLVEEREDGQRADDQQLVGQWVGQFPQSVTPTSLRANQPSMESVSAAKTKIPNAHHRAEEVVPGSSPALMNNR